MHTRMIVSFVAIFAAAILPACAHVERKSEDAEISRQAAALMSRTYSVDGPGAAVLIARGDTVFYRGARGEADVRAHVPLEPGAMFRLGSVTKQFAAAGLLKLVSQGRVGLDDPLSRFLPHFPHADEITIHELLNHTAGVHNYTAIPGYMADRIQRDLTTEQMIGVFANEPLDFAPASSWRYSNSGYVLVGAVIEAVSGMPWHEYLRRTFFDPLGMRHTGYGADPRIIAKEVHGYSFENGELRPSAPISMTQPHAAGAIVSNVDDLLIWSRALHEGRILPEELYQQMITPTGAAAREDVQYGFGVVRGAMRGKTVLQHNGGIFGFTSSLTYIPGPDITIAVLENDNGRKTGESVESIARRLAAIALGEPYPDPVPVAVDAARLSEAEGIYHFEDGATRTIRVIDGALTSQRDDAPLPLTPIGNDDFLFADGFNRLHLERNAARQVIAVRHFADGEGHGVRGVR